MWTDSSPRLAPSRSRVREGAVGPDGVVKSAEREPEGGAHVDLVFETGPPLRGSKLRGPPVRPGVVARARLDALRPVAERSRLVLVSGPAGYGKSTLVAQWSDVDRRISCWLQLDQGDNDAVVLLARIAEALKRVGPVEGELLQAPSRPMPRIDDLLPLLAAELEVRDPFVLVLDDVDVITAERSRAVLAFLVDRVRSGSQLVLVSRGDPGVPLGRLRASGDLVEIGTGLLALDAEETREVAASGGLELSEEAAEALRERTEGWAAGVVLAALSLRGREDAGVRAAGLSGDQTEIADYLLEEVVRARAGASEELPARHVGPRADDGVVVRRGARDDRRGGVAGGARAFQRVRRAARR